MDALKGLFKKISKYLLTDFSVRLAKKSLCGAFHTLFRPATPHCQFLAAWGGYCFRQWAECMERDGLTPSGSD